MARRKSAFIRDEDYSSDSDPASDLDPSGADDSHALLDDDDERAERELFSNPYGAQRRGKKRTREQAKEDATYGIWAEDDDNDADLSNRDRPGLASRRGAAGSSKGRSKDYLKGQSFVKAGTSSNDLASREPEPVDNLSTALAIEPAKEDEDDLAMELDSGSDSEQDDGPPAVDDDENDADEAEADPVNLAPVPGLAPPNPSNPSQPDVDPLSALPGEDESASSLGFAPRGIGARRGGLGSAGARGGIGARTGGIGARSGIGGASGASKPTGSLSMFAAATSLSTTHQAGSAAPPLQPATDDAARADSSTPRPGLGSGSRGGIGAGPRANSLVEALRREVNGGQAGSEPGSGTEGSTSGVSTPGIGSREASPATRPGLGAPKAFPPPPPPAPTQAAATPDPAAPPRERRSFLPSAPPAPGSSRSTPAKPLSKQEQKHFASLKTSNSIGLKLLEKMGWSAQSGAGLGKEGQGIVTPIGEGQKLRRKGEGIKGGERSKASWEEEARRKGVSVKELQGLATDKDDGDDDAESVAARKKRERKAAWSGPASGSAGPSGSSKPKKEKKPKVEFKTYDEIVAESGVEGEGAYGQRELLVDLSGNALADQSIAASLPTHAFGAGSADPTRLPELRHNLTLLTSTLSSSLRALAKEGAGVIERRKYLLAEEERVRRGVEKQEAEIQKLKGITATIDKIKEIEAQVRDVLPFVEEGEIVEMLGRFENDFDELLGGFGEVYQDLRLDEVIVGAVTPICRKVFVSWDPLSNPALAVPQLKRYRKHFLIDKHSASGTAAPLDTVDLYGSGRSENEARLRKKEEARSMSAYETFMWTVWLPKIRSAINNDWSPSNPSPAVTLLTTWSPLLPTFLRDNILDQLILPKLSSAVSDWSATAYRKGQSAGLHTIVFPWLEAAGDDRMEGLLQECKRRVRGWVKSGWKAREGVPQGLEVWKDAFSKSDWDTLLLQHVLPALGTLLRDKFTINPRAQDLAPLESVLAWQPLLRGSMLGQLLETEFFPKWGDALWVWLKSEGVNLEQVAEWYSWWKSYFPEDVVALSGVSRGFRKGLDLMNQAMALGEDAQYRLKKPDFRPKASSSSSSRKPTSTPSATPAPSTSSAPAPPAEVSFRSIVEELCSAANLLFLSTGRTTPRGQNLFRVSEGIEKGRGGVLVYLEDDVVWIVDAKKGGEGEAEPVSIDEMIKRAQK
ncbi:hypothetical protein JCM10212_003335 [Sporobolomyces blumeae]